jgi:GMP synthase (glutamine-hydrolysing)
MLRAESYVRELVGAGAPLLGICFGHQLVAKALGGEVAKNPRGRELGTVTVRRVADDPVWGTLPATFTANASHVESVVALPPSARLLAATELEPHAAFAVGARVRCVQFHPEFDGDVVRGYIDARAEAMRAEGLEPTLARAAAHDSDGAAILRAFVRAFVGEVR